MEAKVKSIETMLKSGWSFAGNCLKNGDSNLDMGDSDVAKMLGQKVTFDDDEMDDAWISCENEDGDCADLPAEILIIKKQVATLGVDDDEDTDIRIFDDGSLRVRSTDIPADKAIAMAQKILHANKKPGRASSNA